MNILLLFLAGISLAGAPSEVTCPAGAALSKSKLTIECLKKTGGKAVKEGPALELYADGKTAKQFFYKDGKLSGEALVWNEAGTLIGRTSFLADKREGLSELFHPNGKPKSRFTYRGDLREGEFETFFLNGQPQFKGKCNAGKVSGLVQVWSEAGEYLGEQQVEF